MCRCHVFLQPTCSAVAHTSIGVVNAVYHLGVGLAIAWRSEFPTTTTILGLGAVAGNVASFAAIEALTIAAVTMTDTVTSRVVKLGRQLVQLGVEASKRIVLEFLGLGVPEFCPARVRYFFLLRRTTLSHPMATLGFLSDWLWIQMDLCLKARTSNSRKQVAAKTPISSGPKPMP